MSIFAHMRDVYRPHLLPMLFLVIATVAVFGRIIGHDFIFNWDDNRYVVENSAIRGFSWRNLREIFTSSYVGNYAPVQMLSYMLDYEMWGLRAGGFLFTNLVLHTVNGLLFYRILISWYGDRFLSLVASAIFLLHPVQVESVAWVSQRKNLLAMLFLLLAWDLYRRYRDTSTENAGWSYGASLAAFVAALLSKSVVVVFPIVLVLYEFCFPSKSRPLRFRSIIPYLLAALIIAGITIYIQRTEFGGGRAPFHGGSPLATFLTMLPVLCRYLEMLFYPAGLSAAYAPPVHTSLDASVAGSVLVLAGIAIAGVFLFRRDRRGGFWLLFYFVALLPVSQIVPLVTLMNDRYLYFPLLGAAVLAGTGAGFLREKLGSQRERLLYAGVGLVILLLAAASWQRCAVWRSPLSLWSDAVAKSPGASYAWSSLAEVYFRDLRVDEAVQGYEHSLQLDPKNRMAISALGPIYTELGELDRGEALLKKFLELYPEDVKGWAYLGINYYKRGNKVEAERMYRKALTFQPDSKKVIFLLGDLALEEKHYSLALEYFGKADSMMPNDPDPAYRLACVAAQTGRADQALGWLEKALARGYRGFDDLYDDQRLASLWNDPRFSMLLSRYFPEQLNNK